MRTKTTKLLSTLLVLCMALALLPVTAFAVQNSGKCGDGLTWSFSSGKLTIQGTGAMDDYSSSSVPWATFRDQVTSVLVREGTSKIGNNAFSGMDKLTEVSLPDTVTSLGSNAFYRCTSLTWLTIPSSVTSIGDLAFTGCIALDNVNIPDGVTSIGSRVFAECSSLPSLTLPSGVTSIGDSAFSGCSALTNVNIPSGVTSIRESAFSGCSRLTSVTIPNGVTTIEKSTFSGCSALAGVAIPSRVTSIGESAFAGCSALTSMTIPDSVTTIGASAFSGCTGLTSLTVSTGLTSVGGQAFEGCRSLKDIYYNGTERQWKQISIDNNRDGNALLLAANVQYGTTGISVTVKGSAVAWSDASPFIDGNNRTMVPLRAVADAMSLEVNWDNDAREASFTDGSKTITFPIDSTAARTSDGNTVRMDTAAVISNNRTYAPIRYLAEFFGYTVGWDAATQTVSLT